jgi:hypothetical protein
MFRHSWRTQLKGAASEPDVLAVVRGFMSEWSRREIEALPAGAWPSRTGSLADVVSHSLVLAELHARFAGDAAQLKLLQEMVLFFTQAAVRAVQLREAEAAADCPASEHRKARAKAKSGHRARARKRAR